MAGGIPVEVAAASGISICALSTGAPLPPGHCTPLTCSWTPPAGAQTVTATVDPTGITRPCEASGNLATLSDFGCTIGLK